MSLPTADQVSALLTLVAPGWIFLRVAAAFLPPRGDRLGDVTIASVMLSIPLTVAARVLLGRMGIETGGEAVAAASLVLATVLAILLGLALRNRTVRLGLARLTHMSSRRIWILLLDRHSYYVQVTLTTGSVLFGWVEVSSNDPTAEAPDLYLKDAASVGPDGGREDLPNTAGVFIPGRHVRTIQFLKP